jgi:hypothetical protein
MVSLVSKRVRTTFNGRATSPRVTSPVTRLLTTGEKLAGLCTGRPREAEGGLNLERFLLSP